MVKYSIRQLYPDAYSLFRWLSKLSKSKKAPDNLLKLKNYGSTGRKDQRKMISGAKKNIQKRQVCVTKAQASKNSCNFKNCFKITKFSHIYSSFKKN